MGLSRLLHGMNPFLLDDVVAGKPDTVSFWPSATVRNSQMTMTNLDEKGYGTALTNGSVAPTAGKRKKKPTMHDARYFISRRN